MGKTFFSCSSEESNGKQSRAHTIPTDLWNFRHDSIRKSEACHGTVPPVPPPPPTRWPRGVHAPLVPCFHCLCIDVSSLYCTCTCMLQNNEICFLGSCYAGHGWDRLDHGWWMCSLKTLCTAAECHPATSRVAHTNSSIYWRKLMNFLAQFSRYLL